MTDLQAAQARRVFVVLAALAMLGLGVLSLYFHDLLLNWQPAAPDATWRGPAAIVSGLCLLAGGALLPTRQARIGAMVGSLSIAAWVLVFHLPALAARPSVVTLLGVAEASAMALGLATLVAGPRRLRAISAGFGACCVVFGVSHFVYAPFTAAMVPAWLPAHLPIAYLTGAVHAGVGIALLAGWRVRSAALVEAAMMGSFVLLLHLPDVVATPGDRAKLTMLGIASLLTAAAGLVATAVRR